MDITSHSALDALGKARTELEEDQIYAMLSKWDRDELPMICRLAATMELTGLGLPCGIGERVNVLIRAADLTFSEIAQARQLRRAQADRVTKTISDVAAVVFGKVEARMGVWQLLGAAAAVARSRGVRISLVPQGFALSAGKRSEIIPFVAGGKEDAFLEEAIERLATKAAEQE